MHFWILDGNSPLHFADCCLLDLGAGLCSLPLAAWHQWLLKRRIGTMSIKCVFRQDLIQNKPRRASLCKFDQVCFVLVSRCFTPFTSSRLSSGGKCSASLCVWGGGQTLQLRRRLGQCKMVTGTTGNANRYWLPLLRCHPPVDWPT